MYTATATSLPVVLNGSGDVGELVLGVSDSVGRIYR